MRAETIYAGSDGEATKRLYAVLGECGPLGAVAINLFRACKASERAKKYRGGEGGRSYKQMAYDRKQWAMGNLVGVLGTHAKRLGITWGWKEDPRQPVHNWVLYVELPDGAGQVSFHTDRRLDGPSYPGDWDGVRGASAERICRLCDHLIAAHEAAG